MPEEQRVEQGAGDKAEEGGRFRLAVWFAVRGDARFLSHRDTMSLWGKALVRAGWPLRYSQGFNPHVRLTLPLPRSVGMTAEKELLLVELDREVSVAGLRDGLQRQLPNGIEIVRAGYVPVRAPVMPAWARYELILTDRVDRSRLHERMVAFEKSTQWPIDRAAHGRHPRKTIDLRPAVTQCAFDEGDLSCTVQIRPEATPRMNEIRVMLGLEGSQQVRQVRRAASGYDQQLWPER